jgi:hypothetical protein
VFVAIAGEPAASRDASHVGALCGTCERV